MRLKFINTFIIIIGILTFVSCEKMDENDFQNIQQEYFYEFIEIENSIEKYNTGDTIWFSANISNELQDRNTGKIINLENQTYILNGNINLLMPHFDTLYFLNQNIDIVEDIGDIQLINVINSTPQSFTFDIKFGKPLNSDDVRFGIITNYPGILAIEFEGWVYYGSERDDYNDFSLDNHKGYLDLSFNTDNTNDSIYYALPPNYIYNYDNYSTSTMIAANKFFFFDVIEELGK